jgi:hypothetical protein
MLTPARAARALSERVKIAHCWKVWRCCRAEACRAM